MRWPTTLGKGRWIERKEVHRLVQTIREQKTSTTIILGVPGSGKSALLARVGQEARALGSVLLAIKADGLPARIDTAALLSEFLGLTALVRDCVLRVATSEKVVVLVDQLDALAELTDRSSGRLRVLLDLIEDLADRDNIHLVCSCREFEFRHDGRLSRLEAAVMDLPLPPWQEVAAVLLDHGVEAGNWPEKARELLRAPQHLKTFLDRLSGSTENRLFTSYQLMLDDLWEQRVTEPGGLPGRADLLMEIAEQMAESEEMTVPRVRFAGRRELVDNLIAGHILKVSENGFGLGFRHQTLFEHARSRAFLREGGSLASFALGRQKSLFVRPTLWNTLNYLRDADPAAYRREFGLLWGEPNLRRHLRHLLIDSLAQVETPPPTDQEQEWLISALQRPEDRGKVLASLRGNRSWFAIRSPSQLPALMRLPARQAEPVIWVLAEALSFARDTGLDLIERTWLPDPAKDLFSWRCLHYVGSWCERTLDMACRLIRRAMIDVREVMFLVASVRKESPELASRLVGTVLETAVTRLKAAAAQEPHSENGDYPAMGGFQALLQSQDWYEVDELAWAAPRAFLDAVWPTFLRVMENLLLRPSRVAEYRYDALSVNFHDQELEAMRPPIIVALDTALQSLACRAFDEFQRLLVESDQCDSQLVQLLFCRALTSVAETQPATCLLFLLDDPRRLMLGDWSDDHADTKALIRAVLPSLSDSDRTRLEQYIRDWRYVRIELKDSRPEDDVGDDEYERGHRLQLLSAFRPEDLSPAGRQFVEEESAALPERGPTPRPSWEWERIDSPMSAEQMATADNEDILALFDVLVDATNNSHPTDQTRGGSRQASRAFGEFAKKEPERVLLLLPRFRPGEQEWPVAAALTVLGELKIPAERLFDVILELDRRGFSGEEFREAAAWVLAKTIKDGKGLPEEMSRLLERWRSADWPRPDFPTVLHQSDRKSPSSILWAPDRLRTLPHGCYPVLRALTYGYLCRTPCAADLWLDMLEDHLNNPESNGLWRGMFWDLRHLRNADPKRASHFLHALFEKYPAVRDSPEGAVLLTYVWDKLPDEQVQEILSAVHASNWEHASQAFGELVALMWLQRPEDDWLAAEIEGAFRTDEAHSTDLASLRLGVAFSAAQCWDRPTCRDAATELLVRLTPFADTALAHAIMRVFRPATPLLADAATHNLLGAIHVGPDELLLEDRVGSLPECLLDVFAEEREVVALICEKIVRLRSEELRTFRTPFGRSIPHLIDIALRLQRCSEEYQERGLALFERLLDLGIQDAQTSLMQLDGRLRNTAPLILPRRRRRQGV